MQWPFPFSAIEHDDDKRVFEIELRRELEIGHPLFSIPVTAIGRRHDQDDVLFQLNNGTGRVAEVHLTWSGKKENPPWPNTLVFETFAGWARSVGASQRGSG